jgi:hypothetical protein
MIQSLTRQTGIGKPFRRQGENEQSHSRDVIRINGMDNMPSAPAEKKKKKTVLDLNSSTMCSVRAHEIIRDTMSPESVSVYGSEQFNRTSNCQP